MTPDTATENVELAEPSPCQACRATGNVTSNLGGTPNTVPCPWCEGTGVFMPEHDAQAHWTSPQPD